MKTRRIVLADRCPALRQGLRRLLEADTGRWEICAEVSDGRELNEQLARLSPDLVILDDELPGLNALEAAAEIRRLTPSTEILLYLSRETPGLLARHNQSKVRGCLLKSEPIEELIPALEVILRHHRFRSRKMTELCDAWEESNEKTEPLTPREMEIMRLIVEGCASKQIADKLGVSTKTITSHRTNLFRKLGLHSQVELVRYAIRNGLVDL